MSHWLVYWVLMLDNIQIAFGLILFFSIIGFIISLVTFGILISDAYDEEDEKPFRSLRRKIIKPLSIIIVLSSFILIFMPSTEQLAAIYLIPKIVSNQSIKQLPPKLSKLALEYVNKELKLESKNDR